MKEVMNEEELSASSEEARGCWWFGQPTKFDGEDGEICNMEAQTQDGSGEIQKTPTT